MKKTKKFKMYRPLYSPIAYLLSEEEAFRIYYKFFPSDATVDTAAMEWALQTELQIRNFCETKLCIPAKPLPVLDAPEDFAKLIENVDATDEYPRLHQVSSDLAKRLLDLCHKRDDLRDHHDAPEREASL